MLKLLGYPDKYSVAPGEEIGFHISAEDNQSFDATLVQVVCGDCNPEGPGLVHRHMDSSINGRHSGQRQRTDAGSYMEAQVSDLASCPEISFFAMIWPTLIAVGDQTVFALEFESEPGHPSEGGLRLLQDASGILALEVQNSVATQRITLQDAPLLDRQWACVGFSYDRRSGQAALHQVTMNRYPGLLGSTFAQGHLPAQLSKWKPLVLLAARAGRANARVAHFNGKIDAPALLRGLHGPQIHVELRHKDMAPSSMVDCLALWDFSREISTSVAVDISPGANHGCFFQAPTRAMKGWNWTGNHHDWTRHPQEYGAVHFHEDDLYDAGWSRSLSLRIDSAMKSGAYALRITSGANSPQATQDYYIPFFVRPVQRPTGVKGKRDRVAFLAPTLSYIAYANQQLHIVGRESEKNIGRLIEMGHADLYMHDHPELGGSLYDKHRDGSGVAYSSRLRPVLNFTSQYHSWLGGHGSALWQYNADTHLFAWLDAMAISYDVITDEDMHSEGSHLLSDYRVIMTGTHPEYYSSAMWRAMKQWQDSGGRLMYLGGNGFYWHVALNPQLPGLVEVRRAEDGIRTWEADPGEYYHAATGELSGLFRRRGHAPNEICGLGFIAQGFDICSYYRRMPDAENPRAAFIFEGVPDQLLGDFGLIGGGAAGLELDCMNTRLGTPPHALRLATSEQHTQQVMLVNEEFGVVPPNLGGDQNERVRADMTYYETSSGGAVFSVGSISWCGSLPVNGFNNNISRITENVLRRFMAADNLHQDAG